MKELCLVKKVSPATNEVIFFVPSCKKTIAISVSKDLMGFFIMQEEQSEEVSFHLIDIENKKLARKEDA
ncbi:hypothetical protein EP43_14900 [Listeria monocytogenes]|uniref:hypothetical protein n=1 Tax=Listeria monocytogenes TaxID=1639 RepID=UPI0010DA242E|nr:hypothetical protein [Listeria monocytogenes]EAE1303774.1 hypothetical protein [Listeria monocytogenes]EAG2315632.1 hypothetical protein [Listeria monocytogenes]